MKYLMLLFSFVLFLAFSACHSEKPYIPLMKSYVVDSLAFEQLKKEIFEITSQSAAVMGVSVHFEDTNLEFNINGDEFFPLASVYKFPIVLTYLNLVEQGKRDLYAPITMTLQDKRHSGCFMDEDSTGKKIFEIGPDELIQRMMIHSDNCATDALIRAVEGPDAVEEQLKQWKQDGIHVNRYLIEIFMDLVGQKLPEDQRLWTYSRASTLLYSSNWNKRVAARRRFLEDKRDAGTPNAFVSLYRKFRNDSLLSPEKTKWLSEIMYGCRTGRYYFPENMPPQYRVAHKTGSLPAIYNDAGWIEKGGNARPVTYAIFMKKAYGKRDKQREKIAAIIKKIIFFEPLKRIQ